MRRTVAAVAVAVIASIGLDAGLAAADDASAEDLALRAEKILDKYEGDQGLLDEAGKLIAASLAKQNGNPHAMVESARLALMRGNDEPGSLAAAERTLQAAKMTNFEYGRTHILLGYVHAKQGNMGEAQQDFFRARRTAGNDPWLKVNYAELMDQMGAVDEAVKLRREYLASDSTNRRSMESAYHGVLGRYMRAGDRAKADQAYSDWVQWSPANAWIRGDYARNVMYFFGDVDAGEKLAREALAMSDYGHARQSLSLALYGKWAAAKRDGKDPKVVQALLKEARANDPRGEDIPECAFRSPKLAFVKQSLEALSAPRDWSLRNC